MKITHCKLKKSLRRKLLEYFVLEVTAHLAAGYLGYSAQCVHSLFTTKSVSLSAIIMVLEVDQVFEGSVEFR